MVYGLNDAICAPVVATVEQFFNRSPMLFGVVMLVTASSHNSGAIAAGRLADSEAFNDVVNAGGRLTDSEAFNAIAKALASRLAVPTVLSTGTPRLTVAAGGTAQVPVRLLVGP
jgi:hypothetical protein